MIRNLRGKLTHGSDLAAGEPLGPAQSSAAKDDSTAQEAALKKRDRLLQIYATNAAEYTIDRDASRREECKDRHVVGDSWV